MLESFKSVCCHTESCHAYGYSQAVGNDQGLEGPGGRDGLYTVNTILQVLVDTLMIRLEVIRALRTMSGILLGIGSDSGDGSLRVCRRRAPVPDFGTEIPHGDGFMYQPEGTSNKFA